MYKMHSSDQSELLNKTDGCLNDGHDYYRGLKLFKSSEIFRTLSIQTQPTDMSSRQYEYERAESSSKIDVNGIELSYPIQGDLVNDNPDVRQFLCVYIKRNGVVLKNGDILHQGVFLSSILIDGTIHLHFVDVGADCSMNSLPIESFDMTICPFHRVQISDPFYKENLLPQKHTEYLLDYCLTILRQFDGSRPNDDSRNESLSFDVSPIVDDISQAGEDGDEDNSSEIDDETTVIDKLIKSSKKPRKNARHFVPDQSNILAAGRSMRSQHRTSDNKNNSPPLTESVEAESAKKKRGKNTQRASKTKASKTPSVKVRPALTSNLSNNRVTPLTNDKEETMKYITEMKIATEALVKRKIEEANELRESRAAKISNECDDPMRYQEDQIRKSKLNDVQGGSIHLGQGNYRPQQHQKQINEFERGQQKHYRSNIHDLQKDSMHNEFNNNNNNHNNQHHQEYLSDQHNHDYQQQQMYNSNQFNNHHQQEQYTSNNYNRGQQQHNMSSSNGHDIQRSSMHQSHFSHYPQQQQYVMNDYNGQQQHKMYSNGHNIQHNSINQSQFSHHNQQQQYNHGQQQHHTYNPNIYDAQHGSFKYQFGQQQLQYHQHVYPQPYSQPHKREEISTFKKVMLCDMMDMMKNIN